MTTAELNLEFATNLDKAIRTIAPMPQLTARHDLNLTDAYAIQEAGMQLRLQRGERFSGIKLGFASKAKREQMGIQDLIWGQLTNQMQIPSGGTLTIKNFIHPRVEPEIVFLVSREINQPIDLEQVHNHIGGIATALEVIDSRYLDFKFSLADVIADNGSAAAYVLGPWYLGELSLEDAPVQLSVNGGVMETGNTSDILGNPWRSVVEAARLTAAAKKVIPTGSIILAGAATSSIFLKKEQSIEVTVPGLSKAHFRTL